MTVRLRNRRRLRRKEVEEVTAGVSTRFGIDLFGPEDPVDRVEAADVDLLLFGGRAVALVLRGADGPERVVPTVRALLAKTPARAFVTVDMGAVRFVNNGADIMAPGIVEADPGIAVGDAVWVRDERNKRPLAVGLALAAGPEIPGKGTDRKGKVVKNLHWVGDEVWNLEA
ncbi:MAG: PUA domain-containing protein [Methanobacteriota archaeon]